MVDEWKDGTSLWELMMAMKRKIVEQNSLIVRDTGRALERAFIEFGFTTSLWGKGYQFSLHSPAQHESRQFSTSFKTKHKLSNYVL